MSTIHKKKKKKVKLPEASKAIPKQAVGGDSVITNHTPGACWSSKSCSTAFKICGLVVICISRHWLLHEHFKAILRK